LNPDRPGPADGQLKASAPDNLTKKKKSMTRNFPPIGGFYELELPIGEQQIHSGAIALSTGRSCLCAILNYLRPQRCLLPYYICNSALEPFRKHGVNVDFYEVTDTLIPTEYPDLGPDEYFMYVNYFGIQRNEVSRLESTYGSQLIVDNTHDFFHEGGYSKAWSFTSARKYFGIPDGAFLSIPHGISTQDVVPPRTPEFTEISLQHSLQRLLGHQVEAFGSFQNYEARMPCELYRMSEYSRCILSHIDFEQVRTARRRNFERLSEALGHSNQLQATIPDQSEPFAYPFLPEQPISRQKLFDRQIYVPTLWPKLPQRPPEIHSTSLQLSQNILPLPIDHRYDSAEMQRIVDVVTNHAE
jgi:hypothetical protein